MDEEILNVIEYIYQYYMPIFLCIFLLGNSLSVCVLFCTKLRYNSSSIYLGALAISDIGVLMTVLIIWLMDIINYKLYWMTMLMICSQKFCTILSVWIVVAFTVQRYIAIKWPLLRCSLCNVNRAKNVVIGLAGLTVLYSIPWFIYESVEMIKSNAKEDLTNLISWWRILRIINFIMAGIIPAIIITIFNGLIVYNIRKQTRIQRNLISSSSASNKETQSSDSNALHIEITKMLVIISSLFICLNTPAQSILLYVAYNMCDRYCGFALFISDLLRLTNYGMDFVLYCATGKNFRTELIRIFTKSSDTRRSEYIEMENFSD